MHITFRNKSLEKICTIADVAHRLYGEKMAAKIHLRIAQLSAASSLDMLLQNRIGRCHCLKGRLKDRYAVDLIRPHRLVFRLHENLADTVCIIEIVDYH